LILQQYWNNDNVEFVPCFSLQGVDHAEEMLISAKAKIAAKLQKEARFKEALNSGRLLIEWTVGELEKPDLAVKSESADIVIVSAGSFHHVLTAKDQQQCMTGLKKMMRPCSSSRLIVSLLADGDIVVPPGSPLQDAVLVGPFMKEHLGQTHSEAKDSVIPHKEGQKVSSALIAVDNFRLKKSKGDGTDKEAPLDWETSLTWSMRTVSQEEFSVLMAANGLKS